MRPMQWLVVVCVTCVGIGCQPTEEENVQSQASELKEGDDLDDPNTKDPGCGEPPVDTDACTPYLVGEGDTCVDFATLKSALDANVCPAGQYLSTVDFKIADCPDGQALAAFGNCCPPSANDEPPPEKKDPPIDDGTSCTSGAIELEACTPIADIQAQAESACANVGSVVVDVKSGLGDCGEDEATQAWFTCCTPT